MIVNFKNYLITESPDTYIDEDGSKHKDDDKDSICFFFKLNSDDTKIDDVYLSELGGLHGEIEYDCKKEERTFPGRIWMDTKVISYWEYPSIELFKNMIIKLEENLNIKMFNNNWRIEILLTDDEKKEIKYDTDFYFNAFDGIVSLIPIEEYAGSENVPDEIYKIHLLKFAEREKLKKLGLINFKGWGSDKTSWDSDRNIKLRQKIYQENFNYKFKK